MRFDNASAPCRSSSSKFPVGKGRWSGGTTGVLPKWGVAWEPVVIGVIDTEKLAIIDQLDPQNIATFLGETMRNLIFLQDSAPKLSVGL